MEPGDDARGASGGTRAVALAGGRTLVLRPVTIDDVDGLAALYQSLTVEDLYRRFFSVYRPDSRFFERVATSADRGGFGLVAVIGQPGEPEPRDGRIVAEAGYELLANGDGELALVVAGGWRGWLGPYLLDTLIDAARHRGVPNLEAEVLITNAAMLSLVRSRGYATTANDDWATVRAIISTAGRVPSWPGAHDRPRILVEVPGARWHAGMAGAAAGLQVVACPGPLGSRTRCPALVGERCPLAAEADAIVMSRGSRGAEEVWDELLSAHHRIHAGVPVCVEVRSPTGAAPDDEIPQVPAGEDSAVIAFVQRLAKPLASDSADHGGGDREVDQQ